MLLLIELKQDSLKDYMFYLNTSNVTVNQMKLCSGWEAENNLNTSNVTVNPATKSTEKAAEINLNTSNVTVNLKKVKRKN